MSRFLLHLLIHLWTSFYFGITFFPPSSSPKIVEGKNAKYQFRAKNTEFQIPSLRYIGLFSQSIVFETEGL